jgi:muramoyltetrapeptide carboxypeptidase
MNRRHAIQSTLAALVASSTVSLNVPAAEAAAHASKPARLRKGQTIGIVAPASNVDENEETRFAIDVIRSFGFEVKLGEHIFARTQYLAGTDRERADDVNRMFADTGVDAIFCLRGGYGTPRMLPFLDYDVIRSHPKILLGYSDITALLLAIHKMTGLIGYHGPIARQNFSDYTLSEFKRVLFNPKSTTVIGSPPPFETREGYVDDENRITRFVGGTARGRLVGGNLSLLTTLLGTPYEPDFEKRILFLEDVGESPYSIDRMLTQLWLAGRLQQVAGIAIGKFTDTDTSGNSYSVEEVIRMRCEPLGVPTIRGLMFGHVDDQTVVPIGINAELDADAGTLTLLEPAVG